MFRTDLLSIIRSLNTVFTAIGICHTSYVDCLLADSQHNCIRYWTFGAGIIFLILEHPVYKMWITQEPKKVALWNKRHFEEREEKKRRACSMFKIFCTYILELIVLTKKMRRAEGRLTRRKRLLNFLKRRIREQRIWLYIAPGRNM